MRSSFPLHVADVVEVGRISVVSGVADGVASSVAGVSGASGISDDVSGGGVKRLWNSGRLWSAFRSASRCRWSKSLQPTASDSRRHFRARSMNSCLRACSSSVRVSPSAGVIAPAHRA